MHIYMDTTTTTTAAATTTTTNDNDNDNDSNHNITHANNDNDTNNDKNHAKASSGHPVGHARPDERHVQQHPHRRGAGESNNNDNK